MLQQWLSTTDPAMSQIAQLGYWNNGQ